MLTTLAILGYVLYAAYLTWVQMTWDRPWYASLCVGLLWPISVCIALRNRRRRRNWRSFG